MSRQARVFGASVIGFAVALGLYLVQTSEAGDAKAHAAEINKIANMLEKGDKAGAEAAAKALAKKLEEIIEVMDLFGLRTKRDGKPGDGIGVGAKPGTFVPDGIEQYLLKISRVGPSAKDVKEPTAFARMAYVAGAIAEVAHAKGWERDQGKKTKKAWATYTKEFRESWSDMVTAAKTKNAKEVKAAAVKMNNSCVGCHGVFK